jgi:chitin synthase
MLHYDMGTERGDDKVKDSDHIRRVFACVTMWHETPDEMKKMLNSVFRMDADQAARRLAQKYFGVVDPDYYRLQGD